MRYRRLGVAAVVVLLVGVAATTARAAGDSPHRYRTATASVADVEQTTALSGTIQHTNRADVSFAVDGEVARVYVAPGDRVRTGQKLASLDTTSLRAAVVSAQAALARAKAQLVADQQAQADAVKQAQKTKQPTTPTQPTQPTKPTQPDPALQQALKELAAEQHAVQDAQSAATAAIAAAKTALAAQQEACSAEDPTGCDDALVAVQAAQDAVAQAQDALQQAIADLTTTLSKAIAAVTGQEYVDVPAVAMDSTTTTAATSDPSTPTAGSIASDQAAIDQAEADLLAARRQLAAAVITAPKAGTVAALDLTRGQAATAGSTVVTIIGPGRTTLTANATADEVSLLKVGQKVTVRVPGRDHPLSGKVSAIGLLPSTGDQDTTYPVTVTLRGGSDVPTGSTAAAAVVVRTAHDVVTVPSSAVTNGAVQVLQADQAVRTPVTVGTVGTTRIQVTGIDAGTTVVLADRDAALPSSDASLPGGGFGSPQGFTGTGTGPPTMVRVG